MAIPQPVILTNPDLTINGHTLKCLMSHVELVPDVTLIEVNTSCGIKEYPGSIRWALKATLYHSFDPAGTNWVLTDAVEEGEPVPFSVRPYSDKPASAANPQYAGMLIPQPFTPISGDVGDASELDLEWSIEGWEETTMVSQLIAQTESFVDPIWTLTTTGNWDDVAFPQHGEFSNLTANGVDLTSRQFINVPVPTNGLWNRTTPTEIKIHEQSYFGGVDQGAIFAAMDAPVILTWSYFEVALLKPAPESDE